MASMNTLGDINRKYWDASADSIYSQPWVQSLGRQITSLLKSNVSFLGLDASPGTAVKNIRMLDYACGGGLASQALARHVSAIRGIDIAPAMVAAYNASAAASGFTTEQMRAVEGDIVAETTSPNLTSEDLYSFDLALVSMALHHVSDPAALVEALAKRLRRGGVVAVVDWIEDEGETPSSSGIDDGAAAAAPVPVGNSGDDDDGTRSSGTHHPIHAAASTVSRAAFSRAEIEDYFTKAGCVNVVVMVDKQVSFVPGNVDGRGWKRLFLARGRRA